MSRDVIDRLAPELDQQMPHYNLMEAYYTGTQRLGFLPDEVRQAVGNRLKAMSMNWARLAVDVVEERLKVEGFRIRGTQEELEWADELWQANNLDEESQQVHLEAILYGRAFVSVWTCEECGARIAPESPKEVWTEHDPVTREVNSAIKRWFDPVDERGYLNVYEPDQITKYQTKDVRDEFIDISNVPSHGWEVIETLRNPLGVVPIIPFINRRRITNQVGESELNDVTPLIDAMNKAATDLMISMEFHAQPRRWATGIEIVEDDTGEVQEPFSYLKGRTWLAENSEARIGSLPEAELDGFINSIEMFLTKLQAIGHVPPHYVDAAKGSLASADSIRASEASLVAAVRRKMLAYGGAWEDAFRIGYRIIEGDLPVELKKLETIWETPESASLGQLADAVSKADTDETDPRITNEEVE